MPAAEILTISALKARALTDRVEAAVHGQIESLNKKATREGKPFWEVSVADAEGKLTLRAWSDGPAFALCEELVAGVFVEASGEFTHNGSFGLDAKAPFRTRACTRSRSNFSRNTGRAFGGRRRRGAIITPGAGASWSTWRR